MAACRSGVFLWNRLCSAWAGPQFSCVHDVRLTSPLDTVGRPHSDDSSHNSILIHYHHHLSFIDPNLSVEVSFVGIVNVERA